MAFCELLSNFLPCLSAGSRAVSSQLEPSSKPSQATILACFLAEPSRTQDRARASLARAGSARLISSPIYVPNLRNYVKRFYPLGPVWQPPGNATNKAPSAPCPPSAPLFSSSAQSSQPKSGMSAVFAELSSGKAVTVGLMRVTDDMKSKNRTDRTGFVAAEGKESRNAFASSSTKAPAKLVLQMGRKWVVEHHIGNKSLIIEDCDTKQSVYVFGCKDCVLQVKGKVNNITIDKCSKMGVLFKGVVAACEVVNCNSVEVQCEVEHSLPQQFIHAFKDGQFTTSPISHSGC